MANTMSESKCEELECEYQRGQFCKIHGYPCNVVYDNSCIKIKEIERLEE